MLHGFPMLIVRRPPVLAEDTIRGTRLEDHLSLFMLYHLANQNKLKKILYLKIYILDQVLLNLTFICYIITMLLALLYNTLATAIRNHCWLWLWLRGALKNHRGLRLIGQSLLRRTIKPTAFMGCHHSFIIIVGLLYSHIIPQLQPLFQASV